MATRRRDALLVALTFTAGCVDGISYLGLGRVLTANMTGNAVLLGLAIGQTEASRVVHSVTALLGFVLGVALGARVVGSGRDPITWSPRITLALAIELAVLMAFAGTWAMAGRNPVGVALEGLIAMSAVAMGIQTAAARRCAVSGVSTTYITGTLTGLMADLAALTGAPVDWRRLVSVLGALVAGATVGGLAQSYFPAGAFAIPGALLAFVVAAAATGFRDEPTSESTPAPTSTSSDS
ncbi:MAG TPA: YoaK family protein [Candidatus Methylomirabilis sp.]|nr:YoaK family protein [Candidatus Methylomirabilis sp.]